MLKNEIYGIVNTGDLRVKLGESLFKQYIEDLSNLVNKAWKNRTVEDLLDDEEEICSKIHDISIEVELTKDDVKYIVSILENQELNNEEYEFVSNCLLYEVEYGINEFVNGYRDYKDIKFEI